MREMIVNYLKEILGDRRKTIGVAVILLVFVGLIGRQILRKEEKPQRQTTKVEKGTIISSVTASGNIISSHIENVTTQASGTVSKVYVSDGDKVYVGQKLAEIDLDVQGAQNHASAYSTYISAVNSLNSAKNNYRLTQASLAVVYDEIKGHDEDETLEMKEDRTRAEVANDNAYDAIKAAEARLTSAALAYKTTSPIITVPVAGVVRSVTVAEGMNIGAQETASGARANQRIATIATEGLPIASFNVSEIDVSLIEPGQKATITLDSITDKTFTGKVVSVDRVGTITSGVTTYPVIIQFDTSSEQILPNMAATAEIITEVKENALWVPTQAVKTQAGQTVVMALVDGKSQERQVEVGLETSSQAEIISGLSEGETVVISEITAGEETTFGGAGMRGIMPGGFGGGR